MTAVAVAEKGFCVGFGAGIGHETGGTDDHPVVAGLDCRDCGSGLRRVLTGTPFDTEQSGSNVGAGLRLGL